MMGKEKTKGQEKRALEEENLVEKGKQGKEGRKAFWKSFLLYYGLMLALYLYFMLANLSMAPKFVYTQF